MLLHRHLHASVEGGAQEAVAVLERGGLRVQHQETVIAHQEVVDRRGVGAGAAVHEDDVAVQSPQPRQQLDPPGRSRLCGSEISVGRGDHPQIRGRRRDGELGQIALPLGHEVGEAHPGRGHAQAGVEVGALEIGVDRHHPVPALRHGDREVRAQQGLANAPLPTADRDQTRGVGGSFFLLGSSGFRGVDSGETAIRRARRSSRTRRRRSGRDATPGSARWRSSDSPGESTAGVPAGA